MKHAFKILVVCLISLVSTDSFAQKDEDILLTINEEKISVGEFTRVYLKNIYLVQDESQKDVSAYLELFKDYKLKIQEAYALGLDDKKSYQKELAGYRSQLARNYMSDVTVTEALIKEAYDRTVEEVNARHILVRIPEGSSENDTLALFNKISSLRQRILNGEDFGKVARTYSEDGSAKSNGGELGWFKAFKMVYPFEEAAYKGKIGEVSLPFRSRFGYHIVQTTNRRISAGEVTAAHIMVSLKQVDSTVNPKQRIEEIYSLLQQGEDFGKLARKYSDDKKSGKKGGRLNRFALGQLSSQLFEKEVFALQNRKDYTKPFKTNFGWHIAMLIERHPIGTYEQMRNELESKVKRDSRAKIISDSLTVKLLKRYGIKNMDKVITDFQKKYKDVISIEGWQFDESQIDGKRSAISIGDSIVTYKDVGMYLQKQQPKAKSYLSASLFIKEHISEYLESTVRNYHLENLEKVDKGFNALLTEYKEGLLLFDLMETKVWNQAKTDSLGLQKYFEANKAKYKWPERVELTIVTATQKEYAERAKKLLQEGQSTKSITTTLNSDGKINIFFTNKTLATNEGSLPKSLEIKTGLSKIFDQEDYTFYHIKSILPAATQSLDEAKGIVASDYQRILEKEWMEGMRKKAQIKINKKVLKKLTQNLQTK